MHWYIKVIKQYVNFSGRARRAEYWYFVLFNFLISLGLGFILGFVDALLGNNSSGINILSLIYSLVVFLPALSVSIRRLHDTGRSGWWLLIGLIPLIGTIVLIVFFAQDSEPGENKYGKNPKGM